MESNVVELAIHERLFAWFETHRKETLWGVIVLAVAGFWTGFFLWHKDARESDANQALARITSRAFSDPDQTDSPQALLKVAAEFPHTDAGGRAQLLAAASSFSGRKYPEARAQFEKYLREYRDSPLSGQALFGVAVCLDAQGKTAEAVSAYSDIIQHHPAENIVPQAKSALGRLYEKQGKWEQARDVYVELSRNGSYGSISSEAAMHLDELFARHPDLALPKREPPKEGTINLFKR